MQIKNERGETLITKEVINSILGICESYELPEKMMSFLFDDLKREKMFDMFMEHSNDLTHDWFTSYFEEEHSNKTKMAQDFTPSAVCDILGNVVEPGNSIADLCAGTGGLTISAWTKNHGAMFYCYEFSGRAMPLLIFNLSIRNMNAVVTRCNLLTGEHFEWYSLEKGERYSHVRQCDVVDDIHVDTVISNPPYSQKYDWKKDVRDWQGKKDMPSNFGDYVFVRAGLEMLNDGGRMGFILPHGVLFRSNKEMAFRKKLIDSGMIEGIIGLPDKLFLNTGIPTCIMIISKRAAQNDKSCMFIDADKECTHEGKLNVMNPDNVKKVCDAYHRRADIERFAHLAQLEEMTDNDYNMNIPRYVDTYVPEPIPDFFQLMHELGEIEREINRTEIDLVRMSSDLVGQTQQITDEKQSAIDEYLTELTKGRRKYEQQAIRFGVEVPCTGRRGGDKKGTR